MGDKKFKLLVNKDTDVQIKNLRGQSVGYIITPAKEALILDFSDQNSGLYWVKAKGVWQKVPVP